MKDVKDMTVDEVQDAICEWMGYQRHGSAWASESRTVQYPAHRIDDAWRVVEKFREIKADEIDTGQPTNTDYGNQFFRELREMVTPGWMGFHWWFFLECKNPAEMLCRAMLSAVRAGKAGAS